MVIMNDGCEFKGMVKWVFDWDVVVVKIEGNDFFIFGMVDLKLVFFG